MDADRFDQISRTLVPNASRRGLLAGLVGSLAAALPFCSGDHADAKKKRRKKKKKRKPAPPPCQPNCAGKSCGPDGCGGECGPACAAGCCANGTCTPGIIEAACGGVGTTCDVCTGGEPCSNGACVDTCGAAITDDSPKQAQWPLQDPEGIAAILVTQVQNGVVVIPAFTAGTTAFVIVTAAKSDQNQDAVVLMQITDSAANVRRCGLRF